MNSLRVMQKDLLSWSLFSTLSAGYKNNFKIRLFARKSNVWRGYVALRKADVTEDPIIQPNYLKEKVDMEVLREGCKIALKILQQPALQGTVGKVDLSQYTLPFLYLFDNYYH